MGRPKVRAAATSVYHRAVTQLPDRNVQLRDATDEDIPALLSLWKDENVTASLTDSPAAVRLAIATATAVLVAVDDGAVIGCLIATFDGWRGNMYRLAVRPPHRRRGIASALVLEGERRLRAAGARRITALIESDHDWAVSFWERAGYELDRRMGRWAKML